MHAGPPPEQGTVPADGTAGPAPTEPVVGKSGPPEAAPAVVTAPVEPEEPSNTSPKAQPPRSKPDPQRVSSLKKCAPISTEWQLVVPRGPRSVSPGVGA